METVQIQKTKIKPGEVWTSPWGVQYRHVGRWEQQTSNGLSWYPALTENWLDAIFEIEKPLRTKDYRCFEYREDGKYRHKTDDEWRDANGAIDWSIIAHYEGWDK